MKQDVLNDFFSWLCPCRKEIEYLTEDQLKGLVRTVRKNRPFEFSAGALKDILSRVGEWEQDWTNRFEKALDKIEKHKGLVTDGRKRTYAPFLMKDSRWMRVYFQKQPDHRYLIIGVKILLSK